MANLMVDLHRTASTSASLGTISADATRPRRLKWYDVILSSEASPADNAFLWVFQRCTAPGTSTAVTPIAIDPGDPVTEQDAGENHTIEPTYTSVQFLLQVALNQRATFRWVAAPGSEWVSPATASNGIGVATPTASAVAISASIYVQEQ